MSVYADRITRSYSAFKRRRLIWFRRRLLFTEYLRNGADVIVGDSAQNFQNINVTLAIQELYKIYKLHERHRERTPLEIEDAPLFAHFSSFIPFLLNWLVREHFISTEIYDYVAITED